MQVAFPIPPVAAPTGQPAPANPHATDAGTAGDSFASLLDSRAGQPPAPGAKKQVTDSPASEIGAETPDRSGVEPADDDATRETEGTEVGAAAFAPPPPPVATTKAAPVTRFFLQAGSFPKQADADRVRAQIILLGQAVTVESGTVKDATWYRVLVGPFSNREQLTVAQKQLAGAGFSNLLLQQRQSR